MIQGRRKEGRDIGMDERMCKRMDGWMDVVVVVKRGMESWK